MNDPQLLQKPIEKKRQTGHLTRVHLPRRNRTIKCCSFSISRSRDVAAAAAKPGRLIHYSDMKLPKHTQEKPNDYLNTAIVFARRPPTTSKKLWQREKKSSVRDAERPSKKASSSITDCGVCKNAQRAKVSFAFKRRATFTSNSHYNYIRGK